MNFYYFIGLIILLIIIYLLRYNTVEKFDIKYHNVVGNLFQDYRFQKYSQNSNQTWKELPNASNAPIVQTYGSSFNDMYKMNQYIFNDFDKKQIDEFVKKNSKPKINTDKNALKIYTPFDIQNINRTTWVDNYNWDPNYVLYEKYPESPFKEVNQINMKFLNLFNIFWFNFIDNYIKRKIMIEKQFFILKYRLVNVYEYKGDRIFEIVVVITRDDGFLAFEFFLQGYKNNLHIEYIANYSLDQVLLRGNLNKDNDTYYNLNPLWANDTTLPSSAVNGILKDEKEKARKTTNMLDNTNVCFTYDKDSTSPKSIPIYAVNRNDCENKYSMIGYKKPSGVWDSPCSKDEDCPFYQQNKNYKNEYGKCVRGKCELPLNMENLGYHYYINEETVRPLCYNCDTKKWLPNTEPAFCCEEQKDKKKYPHLNGPDYAFSNDTLARTNAYKQKNCRMKKTYSNIFQDSNTWEIKCDGDYLDSYYIGN